MNKKRNLGSGEANMHTLLPIKVNNNNLFRNMYMISI